MSTQEELLGSSSSFINDQTTDEVPTQNYRVERSPPDGGWGYCIMLGMILLITCGWGSQGTFSFVFTDFLVKTGHESSALAFINGCYSGAVSFAGLLATISFKKYSMRSFGLCGSVLFVVATTLTVFVTTFEELVIVYGIIQAFGYGMMAPVMYATFNAYFLRRRTLMMMTTKVIVGGTTMFYPLLVEFLIRKLAFRNALAVLAAMSSAVIVSMLLMHPVEWHMRDVQILVTDASTGNIENDNVESSNDSAKNDVVEEPLANDSSRREQNNRSSWQEIVKYLDLTILKDLTYVNIVLGMTFAAISIYTFDGLQPMYLSEIGYSKFDIALIMSIGNGAETVSRILLTLLVWCIDIKARYIYLTGAIATIGLRFVFLNIIDFNGMAVITALLYGFQALISSPLPLIFGEHLPQERFASGYGLFQFLQGTLTFFIQPFAGLIRDATQSYIICFHFLTILMCLCAIPWMIEICCRIASSRRNEDQIDNTYTTLHY